MRIQLDDKYTLCSDTYNVWIAELKPNDKSGKAYERVVSGYYRRLDDLVCDFIDRRVNESEAESIKALNTEINKLKRRVGHWRKVLEYELRERDSNGRNESA